MKGWTKMSMQVRNGWRVMAVTAGLVTIVLGTAAPARAGVPSDQLRVQVDRVVSVLDDTELRKSARAAERRAAIRRIANETFDFAEMSQRALGPHWQARTPAERDEFTGLFADLLERSYIGTIELYSGEKVAYLGDAIDGDFATIRTKLVTKQGTEVPIVYRMVRRGDHWLAYDVSIEGVSLVANYRAQFNKIIQTSGYASLVQRLRDKQIEGAQAAATPAKVTSERR
jgi:phospholipid transport system substrate-binding protein